MEKPSSKKSKSNFAQLKLLKRALPNDSIMPLIRIHTPNGFGIQVPCSMKDEELSKIFKLLGL